MGKGGISIWFFIGLSLLVNGALILGTGIWEWIQPPADPVVLFQFHAGVWWGALLLAAGIFYTLQYAPRRRVS